MHKHYHVVLHQFSQVCYQHDVANLREFHLLEPFFMFYLVTPVSGAREPYSLQSDYSPGQIR